MEIFSRTCNIDPDELFVCEDFKGDTHLSMRNRHSLRYIELKPQQAIELAKAILSYYEDN